ncbi:MAG: WbqC family protein [Verrucomicrobiota bacterium]
MSKRIALLQSNYIPWKGYFDLIGLCDEFVIYDEVQYTKNDWRNRNKVKTPDGPKWITIPVKASNRFGQRILDTTTADDRWRAKHWRTISHSYAMSPFFEEFAPPFEKLYSSRIGGDSLSEINLAFISEVTRILGINTPITSSLGYPSQGDKTERIMQICRQSGATHYLSGPAASRYIDQSAFQQEGITLEYIDYDSYPRYPQPHGDFTHAVSILDLIFSVGDSARSYMQIGS